MLTCYVLLLFKPCIIEPSKCVCLMFQLRSGVRSHQNAGTGNTHVPNISHNDDLLCNIEEVPTLAIMMCVCFDTFHNLVLVKVTNPHICSFFGSPSNTSTSGTTCAAHWAPGVTVTVTNAKLWCFDDWVRPTPGKEKPWTSSEVVGGQGTLEVMASPCGRAIE